MKKLILISALLLVTSKSWAYNETDLAKFKALNVCEGCDLSGADLSLAYLNKANLHGADLSGANLSGVNLTTSKLKKAKLDGAKYCKTKMPCVQSSTFRALAGPLNDPVLRWT
jgi:hypothetical protein